MTQVLKNAAGLGGYGAEEKSFGGFSKLMLNRFVIVICLNKSLDFVSKYLM